MLGHLGIRGCLDNWWDRLQICLTRTKVLRLMIVLLLVRHLCLWLHQLYRRHGCSGYHGGCSLMLNLISADISTLHLPFLVFAMWSVEHLGTVGTWMNAPLNHEHLIKNWTVFWHNNGPITAIEHTSTTVACRLDQSICSCKLAPVIISLQPLLTLDIMTPISIRLVWL